jgi:hypothetical protein
MVRNTHVDELDLGKLLHERRQHLVNELRVGEDNLLTSPRGDEVFEISREVVGAEEGGENVDVVGPFEHLGLEVDPLRCLEEGADDGDAVACFSVDLDHVEGACRT